MGFFNVKKNESKNIAAQNAVKEDTAVVIREDGKEFTVVKSQVAAHLERGFSLKNKKDAPKTTVEVVTGFSDTTNAAKGKKKAK